MKYRKVLVFGGVLAALLLLMLQTGHAAWYQVTTRLVDQNENPLVSKRAQVYGVFISIIYPDEDVPGRVRVHWTDNGGYSSQTVEIRPTVIVEEAYLYDGFTYRPLEILEVKQIGDLSYEVMVSNPE